MAALPEDDDEDDEKKGAEKPTSAASAVPSTLVLALAIVALTVVGVAGGSFLGLEFADQLARAAGAKAKAEATDKGAKPPVEGAADIVTLPTIITNLGSPKGTWVRLEAAVVVEGVTAFERDALTARISEDTVAFLRTLMAEGIESAGMRPILPQGAYYMIADHTAVARERGWGTARDAANAILHETGVAAIPGSAFYSDPRDGTGPRWVDTHTASATDDGWDPPPFEQTSHFAMPPVPTARRVADVNGDGLLDYVRAEDRVAYANDVVLNTGARWGAPGCSGGTRSAR